MYVFYMYLVLSIKLLNKQVYKCFDTQILSKGII